jgi:hypothetical protein
MKAKYILESTNEILNGSKVEIKGKDQAEIDRKKAEVESRPAVVRLIPERRAKCCGAFWDSKTLKQCPLCDGVLVSGQNVETLATASNKP